MYIRNGFPHADDPFRDPSRVGAPPFVEDRRVRGPARDSGPLDPYDGDRVTYLGLRLVETTLSPFQIYRFSVLRGLIADDARRATRRDVRPRRRPVRASLFAPVDHDLLESLEAESQGFAVDAGEAFTHETSLQPYIDGQRIMFDPVVGRAPERRAARDRAPTDEPETQGVSTYRAPRRKRRGTRRAQIPSRPAFVPDTVRVSSPRPERRFAPGGAAAEVVHDVDFVVRQPLGIARPVQTARPTTVARPTAPARSTATATPTRRKPEAPPPSRPSNPAARFRPLGATIATGEPQSLLRPA